MVFAPDRAFDYWVRYAQEQVFADYGDRVSVRAKKKPLLKFGRTSDADNGSKVTLMTLPAGLYVETYPTTNAITTISSTDSGDTTTFTIEGHTVSSGVLTFVTQTGTLQGTTQVSLTTPLARATRLYNTGTSDWTGPIYVYETDTNSGTAGVPDTDNKVHLMVAAGNNQSEKCATSLSSTDYLFITQVYASLEKGSASTVTADIELEHRVVSTSSKVFRPIGMEMTLRAGGSQQALIQFNPYVVIPANSDVRMVAVSNTNDTAISGHFNGVLASVV